MSRLQHPAVTVTPRRGASTPKGVRGGGTEPGRPEGEAAAGGAAAEGLVKCATTGRESVSAGHDVVDDLRGLAADRLIFPTREDCRVAAAAVGPWVWDGREGAVPQLEVAPGLVRITAPNLARREATANRNAERTPFDPGDRDDDVTDGVVRGWSRKSRARMIARLAEIDYSDMMNRPEMPGMVTLTYPGNWQELVPDGKVAKSHLQAFFKRFRRAWGEEWSGIWKLEFQRRGAPHFHLFMVVPHGAAGEDRTTRQREAVGDGLTFRPWLSVVWADIVGATGEDRTRHEAAGTGVDFREGDKARDPKRLAQYFSKHGSYSAKEYQHRVPELWEKSGKSVGRFWGYRGLKPVKGGATLTAEQSIRVARVLRGLGSKSTRWDGKKVVPCPALRRVQRPRLRVDSDGTVHERIRWQTVRVQRMKGTNFGAGYLCVTDGPAVARQLARYLDQQAASPRPAVGLRGRITDRLQPSSEHAPEDRRRFDDGRDAARLRLLGDAPVLPLTGG